MSVLPLILSLPLSAYVLTADYNLRELWQPCIWEDGCLPGISVYLGHLRLFIHWGWLRHAKTFPTFTNVSFSCMTIPLNSLLCFHPQILFRTLLWAVKYVFTGKFSSTAWTFKMCLFSCSFVCGVTHMQNCGFSSKRTYLHMSIYSSKCVSHVWYLKSLCFLIMVPYHPVVHFFVYVLYRFRCWICKVDTIFWACLAKWYFFFTAEHGFLL